ncbi:MAG: Hpt domain-containing protein [Eggerthellaceae bacterium]|nr:Hpt domain-containing protein [Eggerthellaceae bacterium]
MTLDACYALMGGNLEEVRGRLRSDERVAKFARFFRSDETYASLERSWEQRAMAEAFRAAHTLKGVSRDLGFTPLHVASAELADVLRPAKEGGAVDEAAAEKLMEDVKRAYDKTIEALNVLDD